MGCVLGYRYLQSGAKLRNTAVGIAKKRAVNCYLWSACIHTNRGGCRGLGWLAGCVLGYLQSGAKLKNTAVA